MQSISRGKNDPECIVIMLFWHDESLPPIEQRRQAFKALIDDLEEVCDWTAVQVDERKVLCVQNDAAFSC